MPSQNVLAFMAHPDDAEALCGGTLVRLAEAGWRVHIASVTAGDCGSISASKEETARTRMEEGRKAAAQIGAAYHCLGEPDGFVTYDKPAIQKAVDLFRLVNPALVFVHSLCDYHMDHEQVAMLGRAASFLFTAVNASALPVPQGAHTPHLYYCDPSGGVDLRGRPIEPSTLVDISSQMNRKAEMLACHVSQNRWLAAHHDMSDLVDHIKVLSRMRGEQMNVEFAEAFVQHLGNGFPHDDILMQLLDGVSSGVAAEA